MESPQNQIIPRKRTFWKMVKTMFIPAQTIAKLMVGCGGKRGKGKRRLTMGNMQQAKEAFMRASLQGAININRSSSRRIHSRNSTCEADRTNVDGNGNLEANNSSSSTNEALLPTQSTEVIQQNASTINETTVTSSYSNSNASPLLPLVPLNLQEAEFLLESLTLCGQSSISNPETQNSAAQNTASFEVVNVEIVGDARPENPNHSPRTEIRHLFDEYNDSVVVEESEDESHGENETNNFTDQRSRSLSMSHSTAVNSQGSSSSNRNILRRSRTTASFSSAADDGNEFNGWRNSSIEVTSNPPVTLAFIPSGLCIGDRIVWVNDDHPEIGTVRWIGKIRQQFYAGIEFDKPVGNSSGIYGYGMGMYKRLFTCQLAYGRFVPVKELVLYKDYHDSGVKSGIVCVICRDDFLDNWEPDILPNKGETASGEDIQPSNMVSTKCGHLFHWGCLDHWFSTQKRREFHCPFCSRSMERNEVIRIFPSQI